MKLAFLVGMPRSGTTFLSGVLARHADIKCGPETQYFNKYRKIYRSLALIDPFWPFLASRWISKLTLSGQLVLDLYGTDRQCISRYLKRSERSEAAQFMSIFTDFLDGFSGQYLLEKTPNHLLHVPEIRLIFPEARFIRIVRDPRGSSLSMCKLPWASNDPVENARIISDWYEVSRDFFLPDGYSFTLRYEDWMVDYDHSLEKIVSFLGLSIDDRIFERRGAESSVVTPGEPWKNQVLSGPDRALANRWGDTLSKRQLDEISCICRNFMADFNYC